jgi:hypothetical protein
MLFRANSCRKRVAWLAGVLLAGVTLWSHAQTNPRPEKADEWERAAQNREDAATAQLGESDRMLDLAKLLIRKGCATDVERRKNLIRAGEMCCGAGDMAALAAANYEKATWNWLASAAELFRQSAEAPKRLTDAMVDKARENCRASMQRAAEAYEMAADVYATGNAEQPVRSAQSSEKAASLREMIADLK